MAALRPSRSQRTLDLPDEDTGPAPWRGIPPRGSHPRSSSPGARSTAKGIPVSCGNLLLQWVACSAVSSRPLLLLTHPELVMGGKANAFGVVLIPWHSIPRPLTRRDPSPLRSAMEPVACVYNEQNGMRNRGRDGNIRTSCTSYSDIYNRKGRWTLCPSRWAIFELECHSSHDNPSFPWLPNLGPLVSRSFRQLRWLSYPAGRLKSDPSPRLSLLRLPAVLLSFSRITSTRERQRETRPC